MQSFQKLQERQQSEIEFQYLGALLYEECNVFQWKGDLSIVNKYR